MSLQAADRDPSVDPGVDFYRFANGGWIDRTPIPDGYASWGALEELNHRNEEVIHDILDRAVSAPADDIERMLGDYFAAAIDVDGIEAAGLAPIQPFLDAIAGIDSHDDLPAVLAQLHGVGMSALFGWAVTVDHDDSTRNLLWLAEAGLGLPDRESYFADDEAAAALRAAYVQHAAAQLTNVGVDPDAAPALADQVLALETRLAELHLRAEERRDPGRTLNRHTIAELAELSPSFDLAAHLRAIGAGAATSVNVQNPALFRGLAGIIADTDITTIRAYLTFLVVRETASSLGATLDDEHFDFYGRKVRGQQQQLERRKRAIDALTADLGEALSQRFVAETFPPHAKERAEQMVDAIVAEMRHSLETRTWMSDATRANALTKLDAMGVKIGYPDEWRDWSGLTITRDSFAGNRIAANRFEAQRFLRMIDEPVDPTQWEMPPHIVNAYYHPLRNEIVFPAGILQPPMYDAEADDASNFGGIGTVIAHEITHGFDDQGRRFDERGAFRDWWTSDDEVRFNELADRLAAQFDGYVAVDDIHVNGRFTLGENIADLGGLALGHRALLRVAGDQPPIDGLTPLQRFFLANATVWRVNITDEMRRMLAQVDPHSPRHLRVIGPLSNLDAFQEAFGLADDAPMMRPREERIEIW